MKKKGSNIEPNVEELLPIVGIGASAGGLNALKKFFQNVPENSGLAWVVVVHLSPEHKSILAELLQHHAKIPVMQIKKTTKLEPDHIYVIPPNANLNTIDTHLRLSELEEKRSDRAPIDHFFRTLAKTHSRKAIGVILTGTGSDGTIGLEEIKAGGGLTIAQNPDEAEYDNMPQNAISRGIINLVLPLAKIPEQIISYIGTTPRIPIPDQEPEDNNQSNFSLHKIFTQIKVRTGRDFSRYKMSTIMRRLERRMQIYKIEELNDYLELIRKNPEELRILSDDFLITVTNFFRDEEVFDFLGKHIIPKIIKNKKADEKVRIWSVGCATGEEAYSLAILFAEVNERANSNSQVQIFATDLHENSLKKARDGYFSGDIKSHVSSERLSRFFTSEDGGYRIKKELREMVIFTSHNLLNDPPFSKLDLIFCRNLLIYLNKEGQKNVFNLFHYSLRPGGTLVLGTSESIDNHELFSVEHKKYSVYHRKEVNSPEPWLPVFPRLKYIPAEEASQIKNYSQAKVGQTHQRMAERYGPPSVLLDNDYQLMHISENAGQFLQLQGGQPSRDIFKLIRHEMVLELRSLIHTSREKKSAVRSKPLKVIIEGKNKQVFISVRAIEEEKGLLFFLVMFEEYDEPKTAEFNRNFENDNEVFIKRIESLEDELQDSHRQMQTVIEKYETSREEMKASNEELQSANEELRSTLEELETSKEELQSVNEELSTLNQENHHKVEELSQVSNDLENLLTATNIATLFISRELRIMRYTPKLNELFNIRPDDKGRPISDLTNKLGYHSLTEDAYNVLQNLQTITREINDKSGNYYLTRFMPYRSNTDKIEGVVITFVDITERKQSEMNIAIKEERFRTIVNSMFNMLYRMSPDWSEMYEMEGKEFLANTIKPDKLWMSKYIPSGEQQRLMDTIRIAVENKKVFKLEHQVNRIDGSIGWISSRALPIFDKHQNICEWLGAAMDITANKESEEKINAEKFMPKAL